MYSQSADRVENGYYHNADVCEYRGPHVGQAKSDEQQAAEFDDQRETDVFVYDSDALAGNLDRFCDLERVVIHQYDIGSLNGGVGTHSAHSNTDISSAKNRCVVDAVADEGELSAAAVGREQPFDLLDLAGRKQFAVHLVNAELGCDGVGDLLHVTGEHNGLLNARMLQVCNGLLGVRLDDIGDDDVSGVLAVKRHMDYCADAAAVLVGDVQLLHELVVAGGDLNSIYLGDNAVTADLFNISDAAAVDLLAVGALETLADRM